MITCDKIKEGRNENRSAVGFAGLSRRAGSVQTVRRRRKGDSLCSTLDIGSPRESLSQESRCEPESSWPEAKGQDFRFPRPCRLAGGGFPPASDQFGVRQALADNLPDGKIETFRVIHILPVIEAKCLLIDIAKQVVWLNRNVCAIDSALQQAPEVFQSVRVYVLPDVFNRMVNDFVRVFFRQAVIGFQRIAIQRRSDFDVLAYQGLKLTLAALVDDLRADLAATLQNGSDDSLTFGPASPLDLARFNIAMHIARLAADEGLIHFYLAAQLAAVLALMSEAHAVEHEPRGFLRNIERASYFVAADTVLSVRDEPNARKPLVETQGRILKDRTDLDRELALRMPCAALPSELILKEAYFGTAAGGAYHAIRPFWTARDEIVQAVLRESKVQDCFLERLRVLFNDFHVPSVRWNRGLVKYIIALGRIEVLGQS
jgi:hypothetical protein